MEATQNNWYNLNAQRDYPLDDTATGVDDAGVRMPTDLLVDCNLRWPRALGRYAFLTGLTTTPTTVTALFAASHKPAVERLQDRLIFRPSSLCATNWNQAGPDLTPLTEDVYPPYGVGDGNYFATTNGDASLASPAYRYLGLNFAGTELLNTKFARVILWARMKVDRIDANSTVGVIYVVDSELNLFNNLNAAQQVGTDWQWVQVVIEDPPILTTLAASGVMFYAPPGQRHDIYVDTVVLEAVLPDGPLPTPFAAVSMPAPFVKNRQVNVTPLVDGAGGWAVFGDGVSQAYSGQFSTVRQGQLLVRCASSYAAPTLPSLGKDGISSPLQGIVSLKAGSDIKIERQFVEVAGATRAAIVVSLNDELNRNVFQLYAGPCGHRPESKTCDREPIELLNTVTPDCNGNINLEFRHVTVLPDTRGSGGLIVEHSLGIADVCTREDRLPDADGNLPTDYVDACTVGCLNSLSSLSSDCSLSYSSGSHWEVVTSYSVSEHVVSSSYAVVTDMVFRPTSVAESTGVKITTVQDIDDPVFEPEDGDGRKLTLPAENVVKFACRFGNFTFGHPMNVKQLAHTRPSAFTVWTLAKATVYSDPDGTPGGGPGDEGGNPINTGPCYKVYPTYCVGMPPQQWCGFAASTCPPFVQGVGSVVYDADNRGCVHYGDGTSCCPDGGLICTEDHTGLVVQNGGFERYGHWINLINDWRKPSDGGPTQTAPGIPDRGDAPTGTGIIADFAYIPMDFWFADNDGFVVNATTQAVFRTSGFTWIGTTFTGPFREIGDISASNSHLPAVRFNKPPQTKLAIEAVYLEVKYTEQDYLDQLGSFNPEWLPDFTTSTRYVNYTVHHRDYVPYTVSRLSKLPLEIKNCVVTPVKYVKFGDCPPAESSSSSLSESSLSILVESCSSLPFYDTFDTRLLDPGWTTVAGQFALAHGDSPSESSGSSSISLSSGEPVPGPVQWSLQSVDTSGRNILLWDDCAYHTSLDKFVRTDLNISDFAQPHRNGGLVINYRQNAAGRPEFWYVRVDQVNDSLAIVYFDGATFRSPSAVSSPLGVRTDVWYELRVAIQDTGEGSAQITADLVDVEGETTLGSIVASISAYGDPDGKFGIASDKAYARFSFFDLRAL